MHESSTRESIKEGVFKPGMKVSCDQHQSSEPKFVAKNNYQVLSKINSTCSTIILDHASEFMFIFAQTSTEASYTVYAKHKFETFDKSCGVTIEIYYAYYKIFTSQQFKESFISI